MSFKLLDKEHSRDRDLELRKKKKNHSEKRRKDYDTTFNKIETLIF